MAAVEPGKLTPELAAIQVEIEGYARGYGLDFFPTIFELIDADQLNAAFFPDGRCKANFLINLGYGDDAQLFPRNPRLSFDEACALA